MDPALLVFAFSAGAIAFFAPCCIAMLPAYVGYAVRAPAAPASPARAAWARTLALGGLVPVALGGAPLLALGLAGFAPLPDALARALPRSDLALAVLLVGLAATTAGIALAGRGRAALRGALFGALATLGFLTVFLALGLPIAFLARWLAPYLNWLAVLVGIALAALGVMILLGKPLAPRLPGLKADVSTPRGFYLFGLGYGVASLSCTFPVFLAVVFAGAVSGGFLAGLATFAAYALGKGALLVGVTVLVIAGGASAGARVRRLAPAMERAGGILLLVAGAYVAFYFGRFAPGLGG